jgi:hypothetical protein
LGLPEKKLYIYPFTSVIAAKAVKLKRRLVYRLLLLRDLRDLRLLRLPPLTAEPLAASMALDDLENADLSDFIALLMELLMLDFRPDSFRL